MVTKRRVRLSAKAEEDNGDTPARTTRKQSRSEEPNRQDADEENASQEDEKDGNDNGGKVPPSSPLRQVNPAGRCAEAGVIKKVYVENFMCHRKLTIDLCRNVNFIQGQNGSGKSAILAAIQICLGAGARRTHRARNLKELVRKEAGSSCAGAKLRVTLLNRGNDAFQHDIYGDTITVERQITLRSGYNGYKLLDHSGKERSRAKKDLDAMLDQLNIQVENPVAVLDQEEAKKFLTGKPEDKYAFFTKATELERIDRSYASVVDNVQELDEISSQVRAGLKSHADNVKMLQKEWEEFQALELLEDKVSDLRVLFAWAVYNELSEKVQLEEATLHEIENKLAKRQKDLTRAEEAANVTDDEENTLKDNLFLLTAEAREAAGIKSNLENELKQAMAPLKQQERDLSTLRRDLQTARKNFKTATKHLQDARDDILRRAGSAQSEEAKRVAKLKQVEIDLSEAKQLSEKHQEAIGQALRSYEEIEPHVEQAKGNCESANRQLFSLKKKIEDMKSSEGNSLAVFGQKAAIMHRKVEEAQRARMFRGAVRGPIGVHITIAEGKDSFAQLAELSLGSGTLDRFIVTNDADRTLLMKLRREAGCQPRDCGIFQMHDGPRYNVPPPPVDGVETVASVLNIAEDLVFNCLVDNLRIDQIALTLSKESGEQALIVTERGKQAIRGGNLRQVYFLPRGDHWQLQKGNKTMISNEKPLRQSIGVDRTAAILEAEREAELLEQELDVLRSKETDLLREHKHYKVQWNNENKGQRETQRKIDRLQSTIDEIKADAEAAENVTIDTTELEDDVKLADETLQELKTRETEAEQSIEDLQPSIKGIRHRLEETTSRNEKILADINACERTLEEYMHNKAQRQANVEKKRLKVQQADEARLSQIGIVKDRTEKQQESRLKAALVTFRNKSAKEEKKRKSGLVGNGDGQGVEHEHQERTLPTDEELAAMESIPTHKEPDYYKAKIQQAERQIKREMEKRSLTERDPEVALEKFQRAKRALDEKMDQIDTIQRNIDLLIDDMSGRKKRWRQFRDHIEVMTNVIFDEMLNKKGSCGQLDFCHADKTLNLIVQKDNNDEFSQTADVKALSGGERSFTTLSLLLALGENLETPFRVMDEFDVFLDPQSRRIALDTMVSVAKEMEHRQFIFITPQDLSSLQPDPKLKIFRMKAPERNVGGPPQQTLDFTSPSDS